MAAIQKAAALSGIKLRGIHCHIGSSIYSVDPFEVAAQMMMRFAADVRRETGVVVEEVNMGGGLGVRYRPTDEPPSIDSYGDAVVHAITSEAERLGEPLPRISIEPGRGIVGEAGTTLYRVGVVKHIPGVRTYVSVDGGLSDNPRPALYQAYHNVIAASKANSAPASRVTIAGKHCETDTLVKDVDLPPLEPGDILATQTTGAYCYSMASNYNRFARPAAVLVGDGKADLIVEREALDDLVRQDRIPSRLKP
jgi:diaminopimelate decarboxylase